MKLAFRDDVNVATSDQEAGSYFNNTDRMVLLRTPSVAELQELWQEFDRELRAAIKELMLQPYGEIVRSLGRLGFREKEAESRENVLFGMLTSGSPAKSAQFRKSAMAKALIALDLVPDTTPHGKKRTRIVRGNGSVEDYALAMTREQQRAFIDAVVEIEDVDEWLLTAQGSRAGWSDIQASLRKATDSLQFLNVLAEQVDRFMGDPDVRTKRHASIEEKIVYAPSWFAQFLAKRGIWLWPARYVARIVYLYPARLIPLVSRLSVPDRYRELADKVFRYHQDQRHSGAVLSLQAFTIAGLAGNTWSETTPGLSGSDPGDYRWYPLSCFKAVGNTQNNLTSSINAVYRIATEHFGFDYGERQESALFLHTMRLDKSGVDAFNWTNSPTPQNTRLATRLLGEPVTEVPPHVRNWARELRSMLTLFDVQAIKQVEDALNIWLIYLMTLEPEEAPRDFRSIKRRLHIHDMRDENLRTFYVFLNAFFTGKSADRGNRAMQQLRKAFHLAAVRDGFEGEDNPVDPDHDMLTREDVRRLDVTPRKALDKEVWELLVRKNRENDFAFARGLGDGKQCWHTLRNTETGEYETVFWPDVAVIVDIALNSGMRNVSGRWIDSGEGDEKILAVETMAMVPNPHPCATPGREEGFLRVVDIPGFEKRQIIGMYVGINKTGRRFVLPWTDKHVVSSVERMKALQARYNPIRHIVSRAEEGVVSTTRGNVERFDKIYPLFRDPSKKTNVAVTEGRVRAYWKALLLSVQDEVDALYGRPYPLVEDDKVIFGIHALRVTMVSNLIEAGVSPEIVRDLVGHATWVMTWHYNARRSATLHGALQMLFAARSEALERLAAGDRSAVMELADQAIRPEFVTDHVGADLMRNHVKRGSRAPFDVMQHGICPGGVCSEGGEKVGEGKYKPVWRPKACSGCRFRVTGPHFLPGIMNRINNLMAEIWLSGQRSQELSNEIARIREAGKNPHVLEASRDLETMFRDDLTKELGMENQILSKCMEMAAVAAEKGRSADHIMLPASPDLDIGQVGYGYSEAHPFQLMHMLVKETQILPASIMEIPHGVEENWKKMTNRIMKANGLAEFLYRMPEQNEKNAFIRIGDALIEAFPEASKFQQLVQGSIRLDSDAQIRLRDHVTAILEESSATPQITYEAA
ncbi:VPA1269 family protein [Tianweitania sediminis]|uniref:Phage integrase family protein n=1 Tax=Tianweitania sediminis TaxID=1502156 RepID=A0A8J7RLR0_9HYPH|nr:VPA1269 family protein [Tianweitania sediminis]MBP0438054.1 hypothetical protein [Tianweitania sediminis]